MSSPTVESEKIQIKIPAEVAKIMSKWGGHSVRLAAARGALPMSGANLVTVLFVFYHGDNEELKAEALSTFQSLPAQILLSALALPELHPAIIDLIVRLRYHDFVVMQAVLGHQMTGIKSLLFLAQHSSGDVLDMLSHNDESIRKTDSLRVTIINNPHADMLMKVRLGWVEPIANPEPQVRAEENELTPDIEEPEEQESFDEEELEEEALSKYQELQEMSVAEKIKMALTGDKEWRSLLIREANKQVNTAVLKNPRITEPEVVAVAKNRSSSDELIRIIMLNKDWVKIYDIKKALVTHPRTPLQSAMKYMAFLSEKDIKELARSRNVTQAIVNNARRMLLTKKR